jgi:hypothetical protein
MTVLPEIIGLPPVADDELPGFNASSYDKGYSLVKKLFPIMEIEPCRARFSESLEIFNLSPAFSGDDDSLEARLKDLGFQLKNSSSMNGGGPGPMRTIKVCYQNISPFSETFSNEFAPSILASVQSAVSPAAQEISQLFGGYTKIQKVTEDARKAAGKSAKDYMKSQLGESAGNAASSMLNKGVQVASALLGGGRLNFPMIWKSSSYDVSYDVQVRLYNLYPADDNYHNKYIVGPIALFSAFVTPFSSDGNTYSWPLVCRVKVPGLFRLEAGYVKTISIIKGGDNNDIAWNNRPGTVDIRISFGDLYSTLVHAKQGSEKETPDTNNLIHALRDEKIIHDHSVESVNSPSSGNTESATTEEKRSKQQQNTSVQNALNNGNTTTNSTAQETEWAEEASQGNTDSERKLEDAQNNRGRINIKRFIDRNGSTTESISDGVDIIKAYNDNISLSSQIITANLLNALAKMSGLQNRYGDIPVGDFDSISLAQESVNDATIQTNSADTSSGNASQTIDSAQSSFNSAQENLKRGDSSTASSDISDGIENLNNSVSSITETLNQTTQADNTIQQLADSFFNYSSANLQQQQDVQSIGDDLQAAATEATTMNEYASIVNEDCQYYAEKAESLI